VRYLSYIINLVIKAFLFGNDADSFKEESQIKKSARGLRRRASSGERRNQLKNFITLLILSGKLPKGVKPFYLSIVAKSHLILKVRYLLLSLRRNLINPNIDLMIIADNKTR
jgi:hypothetical protein